jgi:hypothetical protein
MAHPPLAAPSVCWSRETPDALRAGVVRIVRRLTHPDDNIGEDQLLDGVGRFAGGGHCVIHRPETESGFGLGLHNKAIVTKHNLSQERYLAPGLNLDDAQLSFNFAVMFECEPDVAGCGVWVTIVGRAAPTHAKRPVPPPALSRVRRTRCDLSPATVLRETALLRRLNVRADDRPSDEPEDGEDAVDALRLAGELDDDEYQRLFDLVQYSSGRGKIVGSGERQLPMELQLMLHGLRAPPAPPRVAPPHARSAFALDPHQRQYVKIADMTVEKWSFIVVHRFAAPLAASQATRTWGCLISGIPATARLRQQRGGGDILGFVDLSTVVTRGRLPVLRLLNAAGTGSMSIDEEDGSGAPIRRHHWMFDSC